MYIYTDDRLGATMNTLVRTSPAATSYPTSNFPKLKTICGFNGNRNSCSVFSNGYASTSPWRPFSAQKIKSLVVEAKKKNEKNKQKMDTHSFVSKPDEATGPFPESVLLKQKKVQEDGRLLPEFADAEEQELFDFLNLQLQSDLDVDRMRHYEVVYLIHEKHVEEVEKVNEKVQDFLREKKGKIWRLNDWGLRRLAYKIQKANYAHYMLMNFELEAKWINDFKSMMDKDERVIRHLVIKRDEAITEDSPPPPEFQSLRADMDDDDDDNDMEDEDWDDEEEDGIIIVNSNDEDKDDRNASSTVSNMERINLKVEKVGR